MKILKGWMDGSGPPKAVNTLVQKPLSPVPEVKSEEISKPPGAEEKSASSNMPGLVTPQTPGPAQQPPEVLPKEGAMKIDAASPSVEEPFSKNHESQRHPEESQAKDLIPNENRESAQAQGEDVENERLPQRVEIRMGRLKISEPGKRHWGLQIFSL